ncbi:hypothetical protein Droror1_Dr00013452 [Drosera rotundifolia]
MLKCFAAEIEEERREFSDGRAQGRCSDCIQTSPCASFPRSPLPTPSPFPPPLVLLRFLPPPSLASFSDAFVATVAALPSSPPPPLQWGRIIEFEESVNNHEVDAESSLNSLEMYAARLFFSRRLISFPYGAVIHKADGPTPTSEFEHSSIPATVKKLFNLSSNFLTKRDARAGTFEKYLRLPDTPRDDCPDSDSPGGEVFIEARWSERRLPHSQNSKLN